MAQHKRFRAWTSDEYVFQGVAPADVLPEDDLVFFLLETVGRLDLSALYSHYEGETRGAPPFDVTMMVTLLLYSCCVGAFSRRKMAAACERNLAFPICRSEVLRPRPTAVCVRSVHTTVQAKRRHIVNSTNRRTDRVKYVTNVSNATALNIMVTCSPLQLLTEVFP